MCPSRSSLSCEHPERHNAIAGIHGKDGVAGSIPAGGSTNALTSTNAGQLLFWDRRDWPHPHQGCVSEMRWAVGPQYRLSSTFARWAWRGLVAQRMLSPLLSSVLRYGSTG